LARRDQRHVHSRPTRRSRDLPGFARATPGLRLRNRSLLGLVQIQSDQLGLARLLGNVDVGSRTELLAEGWLCPVGAGNDAGRTEDRKSTRLNSSHVKISYAVF